MDKGLWNFDIYLSDQASGFFHDFFILYSFNFYEYKYEGNPAKGILDLNPKLKTQTMS